MKETKNIKIMPHSLEAEQAVLGCLLIDNDCSINIMNRLKSSDFYTDSHQNIFDVMFTLYQTNVPIDFVTVTEALEKKNLLESIGGIDYITSLTNVIPSAANYGHYVDIVKKDSILRNLIYAGQKIIERAYDDDDAKAGISFAEKTIFDIAQNEEMSSLEHIGSALKGVIDKFDMIAKDPTLVNGMPTGFKALDEILNGLHNSDLILLAARPGVGKTSLAMNIVNNVAINSKKKCAIFSLEMPKIQLAQRSLCSVGCVSMSKALKGKLDTNEWKALWQANKKLAEAGIYVDDSSMNTPSDILSKCRRLKREQGLDLIMIDYLQLMNSGTHSNSDNRQQEISEITRYLKIAAKELDVPIILLSQLSRAVEARKDHRPVLSDLRESGAIEQDADIVIFIYKADMYNDVVNEDEPGVCEVIIAKHRNGSPGTVKLRWYGEYTTFMDLDKKVPKRVQEDDEQVLASSEPEGDMIFSDQEDAPTSKDIDEINSLFNLDDMGDEED